MAGHFDTKTLLICAIILMTIHLSSANTKETKYLILGAGPAGMRAAEILLEKGITDFIILEGSDHIGGLTQSLVDFGGITVNAGELYMTDVLTNQQTLHEYDWDASEYRNDHGEDVTAEANARYDEMWLYSEATTELADGVLEGERPDIDQKTAMAMKGWLATTPLDEILQWGDFDFVEGVQMKRMSLVGLRRQNLESEDEVYHFITDYANGLYSNIEEQLDEDHLKLNSVVHNIDQTGDKVAVHIMENGQEEHEYIAEYALVTFSLGVLQQGEVEFEPPLPEWKKEQICRFQRSTIEGIFLKFASKFWSDKEYIYHLSDRHDVDYHHYPAFLNLDREGIHPGSNILVAIVTGEEALRVERLTDEQIMNEVLNVLRNMYGEDNVSELQEIHFGRWASDPLHYGTFTTWPVAANVPEDAHERLRAKFGHVYFASEAGSSKNLGRLTGTLEVTESAVEKMIYCDEVQGGNCPDEYKETPYLQCKDVDGEELYGCVMIKKREGKTRKRMQIGANFF